MFIPYIFYIIIPYLFIYFCYYVPPRTRSKHSSKHSKHILVSKLERESQAAWRKLEVEESGVVSLSMVLKLVNGH